MQGRPCTPLHSCLKKYVTFPRHIAGGKKLKVGFNLALQPQGEIQGKRAGVFTQRSGQPPAWEAGNLGVCSACR